MSKKSLVLNDLLVLSKPLKESVSQPLFSDLDRRRRIPLAEVSRITGFPKSQLRIYAMNGTIPGGRQAAPGKRWTFDRVLLEKWWKSFNG